MGHCLINVWHAVHVWLNCVSRQPGYYLNVVTEVFMSDLTLYGIKACDTMKKARTWLDAQGG